jgi:hypothetical protein
LGIAPAGELLDFFENGSSSEHHWGELPALRLDSVLDYLHISLIMATTTSRSVIAVERIASRIYVIRGESVMLDSDLADLYSVSTGNLNLAVRRNERRFPKDFVFQLSPKEFDSLLLQSAIAKARGGRRSPPYAFTEQGVAMLSSVLKSNRAADVNVVIMRTFVKIRRMLATNEELARMVAQHDRQIAVLFENLQQLLTPPAAKKNPIG